MNVLTVARVAGGAFTVVAALAFFGKLEEVSQRVAKLNHNLLILNGYDPATGQKSQPERYQVFDSAVPE